MTTEGTISKGFIFDFDKRAFQAIGELTADEVKGMIESFVAMHEVRKNSPHSNRKAFGKLQIGEEKVALKHGLVFSTDGDFYSINMTDIDILFVISELLKVLMPAYDENEFCILAGACITKLCSEYDPQDVPAILKQLDVSYFHAAGIHINVSYDEEYDDEEFYFEPVVNGNVFRDENYIPEVTDLEELFLSGVCATVVKSKNDWDRVKILVTATDRANMEEVSDYSWFNKPYAYIKKNRLRVARTLEETGITHVIDVKRIADGVG